jgi:ABC-2 type transport system permease protein
VTFVTDATISTVRPPISLIFGSLFRADFTVLLRNARTMLLNFAIPILILVILNFTGGKSTSVDSFGAPTFEIGLALTYGLMSSSLIGYSLSVARDRDAGVFQRLRVTPAPTWAVMASRLLVQFVVDLVMTIVVVALGTILHHLAYTVADFLLIGCVSLLGGAVFLAIGQAVVGLVRSATAVNAVGRVLYVVLLLLGLLGSSGALGATWTTISQWSPIGAIITLYEAVINLAAWDWVDTNAVIASVGYIVVGTVIGIRFFRWEAR